MRPSLLRPFVAFSLLATLIAAGCGGDPTHAELEIRLVRAGTDQGIAGGRVVLLSADTHMPVAPALMTDSKGVAKGEVDPGGLIVRAYAHGYHPRPLPGAPLVPVSAVLGENAPRVIELLPDPEAASSSGRIEGKVNVGGQGHGGALVVASSAADASSTISGADGSFVLFNLAPGSYTVQALAQGMSGSNATVELTAADQTKKEVNLALAAEGTGVVEGHVTFLSVTTGSVRVTLTERATGEAVPGLTAALEGGRYRIEGVPPASYVAWAALENEQPVAYVMDPDRIRRQGLPQVSGLANETTTVDFSVTGAVDIVAPTNAPDTLAPVGVSQAPTFEWKAYSAADAYVLEVSDEVGHIVWGGFDEQGQPRVEVARTATSAAYNFDGTAEPLRTDRTYRWRVYVKKNDAREPSGFILRSMSEDQRGLFRMVAE